MAKPPNTYEKLKLLSYKANDYDTYLYKLYITYIGSNVLYINVPISYIKIPV